MGYKTFYSYSNDKNPLVNQIEYPSGLTTQIQYKYLSYMPCFESSMAFLPVVSSLIHLSAESIIINQTSYTYGDATGRHNFTGYGGGYCLGGNKDSLVDSNDYKYLYNVTITKMGDDHGLKQVSRVYYNFLHLPVEKDDLDSSGKVRNQVLYTYDIDSSQHLRSASFGQPIKLENKSQGNTTLLVKNRYNEYNQLISSSTKELSNGTLVDYKSDSTSYFEDTPYLPHETIEYDNVGKTTIVTKNTLNNNKSALASSSMYFNGSPWKNISLYYDEVGRITNEQISWLNDKVKGVRATSTSYTYSYYDGVLTTCSY